MEEVRNYDIAIESRLIFERVTALKLKSLDLIENRTQNTTIQGTRSAGELKNATGVCDDTFLHAIARGIGVSHRGSSYRQYYVEEGTNV